LIVAAKVLLLLGNNNDLSHSNAGLGHAVDGTDLVDSEFIEAVNTPMPASECDRRKR